MTIANNKDYNLEQLQSSFEDLSFQYSKGNFDKKEMTNLVNKCCKQFLFTSKQEEIINDSLEIMQSNYQHCVDELNYSQDLNQNDQELLEERKTVLVEIDNINRILG
tara:strand:+ start:249 stop:569 length:321 start_codon:yes stop_codon:yes gene_type:complete